MASDAELSEDEFQQKTVPPSVPGSSKACKKTSAIPKKIGSSSVSQTKKDFKCKFCPRKFNSSRNITRHQNVCPNNPNKPASKFICDLCSRTFKRSDHLRAHQLKPCTSTTKHEARSKCMYPGCEEVFFHKTNLIEHIKCIHQNEKSYEPVEITFPSLHDFLLWKEVEEEKNYSHFSMHEGKSKKRQKHLYFYCQHDGSGKPHLKEGESRKTKRLRRGGGIKRGCLCLSHMKVKRLDGDVVSVEYFPLHNHRIDPEDFKHQPLAKATYELIDQQLAWNVAPSDIKKLLEEGNFHRENRDENGQFKRNHYVTEKLIRERKRRTRTAKRLSKDDATSVYMLYEELKKEKYNPVLIYKPVNHKVVEGPSEASTLPDDDLFMFGIQTKSQEELFKLGASKAVLVDDTHDTNDYDGYKLVTVMVPDENNRSWPVAHLITSRLDAETVQYFFMALRDKSPDLKVNCLMTDDTNVFVNAMESAYKKRIRHLLCIWHLHQAFQRNIPTKSAPDFHTGIYNDLKVIVGCNDISTFEKLCEAFLIKYDTTAPSFVKYLKETYLQSEERQKKWAMCHRNFYHANIETTGANESFHNRLKTKYMKRRPNKRIDDLIGILLRIEEDDYATRKRESVFGLAGTSTDAVVLRHEKAMKMSDNTIEVYLPGTAYFVKSSKDPEKIKYHICMSTTKCIKKSCEGSCAGPECNGLCAHLYYCSCPDKSPLCKHIHKLHSFLLKSGVVTPPASCELEDDGNSNDDTTVKFFCNTDPWSDVSVIGEKSKKAQLSNLEQNLQKLQEHCASGKIPDMLLNHSNAVLSDLLKRIESYIQADCPSLPKMVPAASSASSTQKLVTQSQQFAPFRKRPAKRRNTEGLNQHLSVTDKEEVKQKLLSVLGSDENIDDPNVMSCPMDTDSIPAGPNCFTGISKRTVELHLKEPAGEAYKIPKADDCPSLSNVIDEEEGTINCSFTPNIHYCSNLNDTVLKVGSENISLLDLKRLDLHLSQQEINLCKAACKTFKVGWISDCLLDAFFNIMNENYCESIVLSSAISAALLKGRSVQRGLQRASGKKMIIFPGIINNNHWIIVAFSTEASEIIFFDPMHGPVAGDSYKLVMNAAKALSNICPEVTDWTVKIMKHDKQENSFDCAVLVSFFGHQLLMDVESVSPLNYAEQYRIFMYNVLVGNCLKRKFSIDCFNCGICAESTVDQAAVACCNCDQWYHSGCISNLVTSSPFVCPAPA